jgi:anti-sigma regulatory factor (Ser/Thr protein kinase)
VTPRRRGRDVAVLPGVPQSVSAARAVVCGVLGPHHPAAGPAALLVSELAANALLHSDSGRPGGTFTVCVTAVSAAVVRIVVTDAGGRHQPRVRRAPKDAEHGRGLELIEALSSDWGSETLGGGRRVTWCEIPVAAAAEPSEHARKRVVA